MTEARPQMIDPAEFYALRIVVSVLLHQEARRSELPVERYLYNLRQAIDADIVLNEGPDPEAALNRISSALDDLFAISGLPKPK